MTIFWRSVLLAAVVLLSYVGSSFVTSQETALQDKKIFLAILARNKAHVLPRYLKTIENLDYDKKLITVYINTNNNKDGTDQILKDWAVKNENRYNAVIFENHDVKQLEAITTNPHEWKPQKLKTLAKIRTRSLQKAKELGSDFYFVVDCDNFIVPETLKILVSKDKPIIAPLLFSVPEPKDEYCNYFYDITENGYFKDHPNYYKILYRSMVGTFKVPLVHCTYLVKMEHADKLSYLNNSDELEFIIFARSARESGVDQYICNEIEFGNQIHYNSNLTLAEESQAVKWLFIGL